MINTTLQHKSAGKETAQLHHSEGELQMSELGLTTVRYQKTINMGNYESLTIGVEVSMPNDESLHESAEKEIDAAQKKATELAEQYIEKLRRGLSGNVS